MTKKKSQGSVLFVTKLKNNHFKMLLCANATVIDMMVDPDGTLDVLSNLSLTSPLTDQKFDPGTQQGAPVLPGAGASSGTAASEGLATESRGPSNHAEVAERD